MKLICQNDITSESLFELQGLHTEKWVLFEEEQAMTKSATTNLYKPQFFLHDRGTSDDLS